jgi:hypothetical protein
MRPLLRAYFSPLPHGLEIVFFYQLGIAFKLTLAVTFPFWMCINRCTAPKGDIGQMGRYGYSDLRNSLTPGFNKLIVPRLATSRHEAPHEAPFNIAVM